MTLTMTEGLLAWEEPTSAITTTPSPWEVAALRDRYLFRAGDSVSRYLGLRPHLIPLLFEAIEWVERIFGLGTALALEVHHDPADGTDELFALIQAGVEPVRAGELLDQLDELWWLDVATYAAGDLNFDVELA